MFIVRNLLFAAVAVTGLGLGYGAWGHFSQSAAANRCGCPVCASGPCAVGSCADCPYCADCRAADSCCCDVK